MATSGLPPSTCPQIGFVWRIRPGDGPYLAPGTHNPKFLIANDAELALFGANDDTGPRRGRAKHSRRSSA